MRIISGKAGRTAIKVPTGVTRPTTDFLRQAIFSILSEKIVGARVLDLFAGSGAIGLEALSRGAIHCQFVEQQRQACAVIEHNLAKCRLEGGTVRCAQVHRFLPRDHGHYDVIFADPPYWKHHGDSDHLRDLAESIAARLQPDGWFIAEAASHYEAPEAPGIALRDRRSYGGSSILLYAVAGSA